MKYDVTITPLGNIQTEVENKALGIHYISGVDNVRGIEVLTSVASLKSCTIFIN